MGNHSREKDFYCGGDQGFGDEIMFASIVPDLIRMSAIVTLECSRELRALFARSFPGVEVLAHDFNGAMPEELNARDFDYEIPLGSLGGLLRNDAKDFPCAKYLESAVTSGFNYFNYSHYFNYTFGETKRIVGLSWRGGTVATRQVARSLTLDQLSPLTAFKDILFVVLQHDVTTAEHLLLKERIPKLFCDLEALHSLDQTASMISACDCVLTVCNTVVHLAGALGKRVNVLAPFAPEWRYGFDQMMMPWYPHVHVYRQTQYGDWTAAINRASVLSLACPVA